MRTVSDNGLKTENQQGLDYRKILIACGNRRSSGKSCFYEFAAEKTGSFTKFVQRGRSKFISSMNFHSQG